MQLNLFFAKKRPPHGNLTKGDVRPLAIDKSNNPKF